MTLAPLFEPQSIAVVGASADPRKAGSQILRSLSSFPGLLIPINPRERKIEGHTCHPRLSAARQPVDLAVLAVPPEATESVLEDGAAVGLKAAVVCSGGFAETGIDGAALQARTAAVARKNAIRLLGPNTSGFINPARSTYATFVQAAQAVKSGPVAVIAQSGGIMHALAFLLTTDGAGVRLAVGLGNAADVGFVDVLEHVAEDGGVRVIVLAVEGVEDGRALCEAVARVTTSVPVVAIKTGRADVSALALSHTGALTGSWQLARSALHQAGAVVVESTVEAVDAARALVARRLRPTARPGVAVITGQAGPGLAIEDTLRSSGVELPDLTLSTRNRIASLLPPLTYQRNPIDTGRPSTAFSEVVTAVAGDPAINALVIYALHEPAAFDPAAALAGIETPTVFGTGGPRDVVDQAMAALAHSGIPVYPAPERAALAARALVADARAAHRRVTPAIAPKPESDDLATDEHEAKRLLESLGVRTPQRRPCSTDADVGAAFDELGPPVVLKILQSGITHKSDVGGVHLDLRSCEQLRAAADAIRSRFGPAARFLVEEMLPPGVELIVGASRNASFGASVLVGLGGVEAEALADVAVRLAPLTELDAHEMIGELRRQPILDGHRGMPSVNRDELAQVITTIGGLIAANGAIGEIDVNPLRATADGLVALDAVVVPRATS